MLNLAVMRDLYNGYPNTGSVRYSNALQITDFYSNGGLVLSGIRVVIMFRGFTVWIWMIEYRTDFQRSAIQMVPEWWTIFVRYSDGSAKLTLSTIVKHLILVTHIIMTHRGQITQSNNSSEQLAWIFAKPAIQTVPDVFIWNTSSGRTTLLIFSK